MTTTSAHDESKQLRDNGRFAGNIPSAPPAETALDPATASGDRYGAEPTIADVDANLEAIDEHLLELTTLRAQVNRQALGLSVREKFADAQTMHFKYVAFQGNGITLVSVTDKGGKSLWDLQELTATGEYGPAREWQDSLSKYVLNIDHHNDKTLTPSEVKHFGADLDLGPARP